MLDSAKLSAAFTWAHQPTCFQNLCVMKMPLVKILCRRQVVLCVSIIQSIKIVMLALFFFFLFIVKRHIRVSISTERHRVPNCCIYDHLLSFLLMLHHSFPRPPSLFALILIEMPSWISPNGCSGATFGCSHAWKSSSEWVAAVWIRCFYWGCWQNICHEKTSLGNSFERRDGDMFGVAMTVWVIREERIVLLGSYRFSLPCH